MNPTFAAATPRFSSAMVRKLGTTQAQTEIQETERKLEKAGIPFKYAGLSTGANRTVAILTTDDQILQIQNSLKRGSLQLGTQQEVWQDHQKTVDDFTAIEKFDPIT